ncbi:hypothetical protein BDC45DRAFT_573296 [Circinella umbellata]|nr:hypothetical protein BDC45DRAFT_573296 [Circinella umbellata]
MTSENSIKEKRLKENTGVEVDIQTGNNEVEETIVRSCSSGGNSHNFEGTLNISLKDGTEIWSANEGSSKPNAAANNNEQQLSVNEPIVCRKMEEEWIRCSKVDRKS